MSDVENFFSPGPSLPTLGPGPAPLLRNTVLAPGPGPRPGAAARRWWPRWAALKVVTPGTVTGLIPFTS